MFLFWGCCCRYPKNSKRFPPKKILETLKFVLPAWISRNMRTFTKLVLVTDVTGRIFLFPGSSGRENRFRVSKNQKKGKYLLVFVEYLCNHSPKMRTKDIKNSISILGFVNYQHCLDASPPLSSARLTTLIWNAPIFRASQVIWKNLNALSGKASNVPHQWPEASYYGFRKNTNVCVSWNRHTMVFVTNYISETSFQRFSC